MYLRNPEFSLAHLTHQDPCRSTSTFSNHHLHVETLLQYCKRGYLLLKGMQITQPLRVNVPELQTMLFRISNAWKRKTTFSEWTRECVGIDVPRSDSECSRSGEALGHRRTEKEVELSHIDRS